ncbi:WXG100 family type VII secretion target [Mycolicibacterium fortuitum]|uniref:PPE family protein n=1 Tax=Mycolicibacterium fortuitum TaxID=1766 RepID=A0A378UY38_MYCFO|nr:WXG100 family type VII secretion target [Mycolicibacterium fortuitum]MCA4751439.1 WXG100 family type VII secretion target [Mycolicibacterium fortuitum]MDG5769740.1 WXG100 family type VII secretion target [Mycolicibacterium fortuitum]MDG5784861.1 WXG100 family type VII secretion target [Mycolicibacterium fortuitum]OBI67581.1 hypothetical protein A5664_12875 [Mycolicibacterium fortuitum]OBK66233.1 hypothetical protein A5654_18830 [Mycolicibacterium fortuitum]
MALERDSSPYGSQTLLGPGWPNVDEDQLTQAAASYQKIAAKISGTVVPQQTSQLSKLQGNWEGAASLAASGEATTMIGGHEANGLQAQAISTALMKMAATVVETKTVVNAAAQEVQHEVEMILNLGPLAGPNVQALIESRVKAGLAQNTATVSAASAEMADSLGTIANLPQVGTPPTAQAQQAAQKGTESMMQLISQLPQLLGQIPQMAGQIPQQLSQPLQQLSQPLQQLTSMLGSGGKGTGAGPSPFSAFSNHPAAGGSGPSSGAGMVKAAGLPGGAGGGSPQTPLLAKMVGGGSTAPVSVDPGASAAVVGGVAPVAAANSAGGMGGGMGMMGGGQRAGGGGGTATGLAVPAPLEHDMGDGDDDYDDW